MWAAKREQAAEYASANHHFPMWAAFGIGIWGIACLAGFLFLFDYSTRPSNASPGYAENWPASSALKQIDNGKHIVVFLHPKCPCSRATMRELERMIDLLRQPALSFVFFKPEQQPDTWVHTNLWRSAQVFKDAKMLIDIDAAECNRFGARTSGCVMLFNSRGKQLFCGGITSGRGHEGDTAAKQNLAQLIRADLSEQVPLAEYPVFGCPIQSTKACSQCQFKGRLDA